MAVLDSTGLARGLGVFRYTATSMPILHLVLWEMGEYTHFSLRPQLPAGGALDVWPLVVEPALTAEDLGSLIVEERTHLAQMLDQDLANVLLEVIRAAERLVVDQDLARGGPLVLAVSDALSRSKTLDDSAESKAVIGSLRDASWRAVAEGWYGSIPHILEAGFALADLVDRADEITGGYLLLDHIWEATGLLGTKPTQAMDIAYWCGNEDVRQLARQIHWIKESWGQVEAAVSERNLIVLQGLLTGITDAFADRDTQNCVARMAAFQRQLDQLHVQIIEPACLAPLLPVFLITKSAVKIGIRSLGQARRGDTCRRGPAPRPTAVQASV